MCSQHVERNISQSGSALTEDKHVQLESLKISSLKVVSSYPVVTPSGVLGRSRAGSSEILMASFMVAIRPWPPSPLKAGPKHSGRLIRSFTTTLAFSSTLSPWTQTQREEQQELVFNDQREDGSKAGGGEKVWKPCVVHAGS